MSAAQFTYSTVSLMKKTRQDFSCRVLTVVLAGPGAESARCQAKTSLAGDPSEVTALDTRHWITSFRCWWKGQYKRRICRC